MSNFSSLENITTEIQSLIRQMNAGKLQMEDLENLNSLTRELNERIVILKYKAYEEKVFGVSPKTEMEEQLVSGKEIQNVISHMSDFLMNDSSGNLEEVQEEPAQEEVAGEVVSETQVESLDETSDDDPVFGFDLFESESSVSFAPELKPDMETFSETRPIFSREPEVVQQAEIEVKEEKIDEIKPEPIYTPNVENPQVEVKTIEVQEEDVVDEFIQTEDITTVSQIDVFKNFQGLDSGSRLMSPKIQSLVGAFGLNEKLQCIRELYNGSSDAFNQAIEKVDNQSDFVSAKEVLSQHAIENSWDLESNLVNEFLQKVERRFL